MFRSLSLSLLVVAVFVLVSGCAAATFSPLKYHSKAVRKSLLFALSSASSSSFSNKVVAPAAPAAAKFSPLATNSYVVMTSYNDMACTSLGSTFYGPFTCVNGAYQSYNSFLFGCNSTTSAANSTTSIPVITGYSLANCNGIATSNALTPTSCANFGYFGYWSCASSIPSLTSGHTSASEYFDNNCGTLLGTTIGLMPATGTCQPSPAIFNLTESSSVSACSSSSVSVNVYTTSSVCSSAGSAVAITETLSVGNCQTNEDDSPLGALGVSTSSTKWNVIACRSPQTAATISGGGVVVLLLLALVVGAAASPLGL